MNSKIESSSYYRFTQRHRKVLLVVQGLIVIGLLISINTYVYQDHFLKKQIAERCGYVDSKYKCICEAHYAEDWEALQKHNLEINMSNVVNVSS